jgi:hypothetical protein
MHELPFGAKMTKKLFQIAQKHSGRVSRDEDCVRSIVWAPQSFAVPGRAGWVLAIIPTSHAKPERVFDVDGLSLYISAEVEPLVREQVFDWDHTRGMVSHAA